ncbi:hypothetical protein QCA50_018280 [Cerrena zonata]|uniref:Retrotransposon gag domain-containing protein n=1 Tax=Cerrena zonata TaxID=2478898 RepID=A0AAW0FBB4_9APHY
MQTSSNLSSPEQYESSVIPVPVTKHKYYGSKPPIFDGAKSEYAEWKSQVIDYCRMRRITDSNEKINIFLSFMRGGTVCSWVRGFVLEYQDSTASLCGMWKLTYTEFLEKLDVAFTDVYGRRLALTKLVCMRDGQGSQTAREFLFEFEDLVYRAGCNEDNPIVLELLKMNVNFDIIQAIYGHMDRPSTFDEWRTRIIDLDDCWRAWAETKKLWAAREEEESDPYMRLSPDPICFKCKMRKSQKGVCGSPWHIENRPQMMVQEPWEGDNREEFIELVRRWAYADQDGFNSAGFFL